MPHLQCALLSVVWMNVQDLYLLPVYHVHLFHCMLSCSWLQYVSWCQGSFVFFQPLVECPAGLSNVHSDTWESDRLLLLSSTEGCGLWAAPGIVWVSCEGGSRLNIRVVGGWGGSWVSCVWTWPNGRHIQLDKCMAISFYSYSEHTCLFTTVWVKKWAMMFMADLM